MKRFNNLFGQICELDNLQAADQKARKGKGHQVGIKIHDQNRDANILAIRESLINKTYRTSPYKTFKIVEPKERIVYCLPYYPDRILHHAIMIILEPILTSTFTADTYSCIKGKGIHAAAYALRDALKNESDTRYCLKLDIRKFYPSIDHAVLKSLLRRKFKDPDLLWLLDEIIESAEGLPIGNYLSQFFANFYLTRFDHFVKEVLMVKNYFRYADDIVILGETKIYLHLLLSNIRLYLAHELMLEVKDNYQVFPVKSRGIDFLGYVFFHYGHTRIRKSIKKNFILMIRKRKNSDSIAAYNGWFKHCNSRHLLKKVLTS